MREVVSLNEERRAREGLDILRGIGIVGIVLYHLFPGVVRGGFLGVTLFFALSGYLMVVTGERSWEQGNFRVGQYYGKRAKKIIPPMFVMVAVVCCYLTLVQSSRLIGMRNEVCGIFLGCGNWWRIWQGTSYFSRLAASSPFAHLWFLAVEIQFYLLWPFVFLFYKKCCHIFGGRKACFLFVPPALASAAAMYLLYVPGEDPSRVYYGTDTMGFSLFVGMFLGAARQHYAVLRMAIKRRAWLVFTSLFLITCVLFVTVDGQNPLLYRGGMFLTSAFFVLAINVVENQENLSRLPGIAFCSRIGKWSYVIYLWHYPLIVLGTA